MVRGIRANRGPYLSRTNSYYTSWFDSRADEQSMTLVEQLSSAVPKWSPLRKEGT